MGTINKKGCSTCAPGCENYTTYTTTLRGKRVKRYQYDYRTQDGILFSYVGKSLAECREKRDEWKANIKL